MSLKRCFSVGAVLLLAVLAAAPLRALPPEDSMHQRVLPCLACHDETAIDLESGNVPRLHGKPAGYLYNQLLNYRDGRRHNRVMVSMISHLSDEYLGEMAEYFASLDAPYPTPPAVPMTEALQARGRELVTQGDPALDVPSCQSCHGERLTGVLPNTPGLIGLPSHYLMAQFGAWQTGTRRAAAPDCMQAIAGRLPAPDVRAVAYWIASQPVPQDTRPNPQPVAQPPMDCGSVTLPGE